VKAFTASGLQRGAGERQDPAAERRLIEAARRGDRRALDQVVRRLSGSLYRFGRGFCRDPHDAEDVMQEALTALVSSLDRFRGDASLSSWAYVVARNACSRRRRRDTRHQSLERPDREGMTEFPDPHAGPERTAERRELREALERAILALPASLRDVLVLRDVEGLSAAAVGKRLKLGERAVKSRLHRARVSLRELLAPHLAVDVPARNPECPDVVRMFSRFLEGELDARTCSRLEAHVSSCAGCGAACAALREALSACAAWKQSPAPPRVLAAVRAALREIVAGAGTARTTRG
jgi:RNA polymerase sigma-70 factor (ECF subfamily)